MKKVPHLFALAAKACVFQRLLIKVVGDPERKDALIYFAELTGPGDHSASIDDRAQAISLNVFLNYQLGGELGRPVQRSRKMRRKIFRDSIAADPGTVLVVSNFKTRLSFNQLDFAHRAN